ncbi:hypothetical protein ABW20_dc0102913 [Dactylellina cionopaga]|nr:hypothetical protein ABW20_dc0102913 [Dactylellina cionopaga]
MGISSLRSKFLISSEREPPYPESEKAGSEGSEGAVLTKGRLAPLEELSAG